MRLRMTKKSADGGRKTIAIDPLPNLIAQIVFTAVDLTHRGLVIVVGRNAAGGWACYDGSLYSPAVWIKTRQNDLAGAMPVVAAAPEVTDAQECDCLFRS